MARKKTRTADGCTESTDSSEKYDSKGNCPHIVKGVDIGGLKKAWKKKEDVSCQLCKKKQFSAAKKTAGVENDIWVCMNCGHVGCGNARHDHGMDHFNTPHSDCHSVVAVVDTWTLRCLQCRLEINLEVNAKASDAIAYLKKNFQGSIIADEAFEDNSTAGSMDQKPCKISLVPQHLLMEKNPREQKVLPILGLENLGNTCYMNAVLQCLAQTPNFVKSLANCLQSKTMFWLSGGDNLIRQNYGDYLPPLEGILGEGGQLTKAVYRILQRVRNGSRFRKIGMVSENAGDVIKLMKKQSNTFYVGEQHDAHELLRFLLEALKNEDLKRYQRGILTAMNIGAATKEVLPQEREFLLAYKNQAQKKKLVIENIFGGSLVSILKCLQCSAITTTFESFMDVSLPVESEKFSIQVKSTEKLTMPADPRVSKYQQKKERKMARRSKKKQRVARVALETPSGHPVIKNSNSSNESDTDSEADVEDNIDSENVSCIMHDGLKTDVTPLSKVAVLGEHQDCEPSFSEQNYKDGPCEGEKLYPYTALIFGPNQYGSSGQLFEKVIPSKPKISGNCISPELTVAEPYCCTKSSIPYGGGEENPAVAYGSGSPEPSLNDDFGSCEGGRGSPASSIEQDDWEDVDEEKENIPVVPEYSSLVQGVEEALQLDGEQYSVGVPSPESFDFLSNKKFKEESLPHTLESSYSTEIDCNTISRRYTPFSNERSFSIPLSSGTEDNEMSTEILTSDSTYHSSESTYQLPSETDYHSSETTCDTTEATYHIPEITCNHSADTSYVDKQVIADVGVLVGTDTEEPEGDDIGHPDNLSNNKDQCDGSGNVWGATLAPPLELENAEYSLNHCLQQFFNKEILSGPNTIGCTKCTQRREGREPNGNDRLVQANALKQLLFVKLPEVLTIHLKRFELVGGHMGKITRKVSFPLELDVAPYTSAKVEANQVDAPPLYQLYGVVEHHGHLTSGHYVAYVKVFEEMSGGTDQLNPLLPTERFTVNDRQENIQRGVGREEVYKCNDSTAKWYYISDAFAKETSEEEVLNAEAYILFYRRIE